MTLTLQHYLILSVLIFTMGAAGAVARRNLILVLMSLELMLAAGMLAVLAFARWNLLPEGGAIAIFIIAVMVSVAAAGSALVAANKNFRSW